MKKLQLVNLTPHDVNIFSPAGEKMLTVHPEVATARVSLVETLVETIEVSEGVIVPVYRPKFGEVENLPEPEEGIIYIVSALVKSAAPHRRDLVSPDNKVRRDGFVVGTYGFLLADA